MYKVKNIFVCIISVTLIIIASCSCHNKKNKSSTDTTKKDTTVKVQAGSIDDAKRLVNKFVEKGANYATLTNNLRPTIDDAKALFNKESDATKAFNYINSTFEQINKGKVYFQPKANQTECIIISATATELKEGKSNSQEFPAGYRVIAPRFKEDAVIYLFKFVKKGEKEGLIHYGLTYVNNHWVVFLKVWKAFAGTTTTKAPHSNQ